uniref:NADH dehydrogenase subunit 6 n=1 Tax=Amblyomma ovale TaxID=208206 RepID=A0A7D5KJP0_9ACAR|nr:NADH dehydrogenase subunit 6 [Amblyomma ovale]
MKIKVILMMSTVLISMSHPVAMLMSVILLTLSMSLIFYENSANSLFPMILLLLILGGMMIIFLYMVSLCPNKKLNYNIKLIFTMMMIVIILSINPLYFKVQSQELTKIYCTSFLNIVLMMMMYLLITLMVVMKNLNWISSPMKSF